MKPFSQCEASAVKFLQAYYGKIKWNFKRSDGGKKAQSFLRCLDSTEPEAIITKWWIPGKVVNFPRSEQFLEKNSPRKWENAQELHFLKCRPFQLSAHDCTIRKRPIKCGILWKDGGVTSQKPLDDPQSFLG